MNSLSLPASPRMPAHSISPTPNTAAAALPLHWVPSSPPPPPSLSPRHSTAAHAGSGERHRTRGRRLREEGPGSPRGPGRKASTNPLALSVTQRAWIVRPQLMASSALHTTSKAQIAHVGKCATNGIIQTAAAAVSLQESRQVRRLPED